MGYQLQLPTVNSGERSFSFVIPASGTTHLNSAEVLSTSLCQVCPALPLAVVDEMVIAVVITGVGEVAVTFITFDATNFA